MSLAEKLVEKEREETERNFDTQFWKPNKGDILEGKVIKVGETITEYGERVS